MKLWLRLGANVYSNKDYASLILILLHFMRLFLAVKPQFRQT